MKADNKYTVEYSFLLMCVSDEEKKCISSLNRCFYNFAFAVDE